METIFSNSGLNIIAIEIFKKLDAKSRLTSRLVAKSWRDIIDNNTELCCTVDPKSISQMIEKFPDWYHILILFNRKRSLEEVSKLAQILQAYFASDPKMESDPFLSAAKSNKWDTVNFLLPRIQSSSESNKRYLLKIIGDILNGDFKNQGNNLKDPSYREFTRMICE